MPIDAVKPPADPSPDHPLIVRRMALQILSTVDRQHRTLDAIIENFRQRHLLARQRDRALLQAIVFGVLRWRGRLDFVIGTFSRTPLDKIQPDILNILRIALFQVMFMDRIPVSAAVNTAVELAKPLAPEWVVRFVNAVLRKAAAGHKEIGYPLLEKDPVAALAAAKSFAPWMVRRWLDRCGPEEATALCEALNTIPPVTLRANTLKIERTQLLRKLADEGQPAQPAALAPDGLLLGRLQKPVEELETFVQGLFQVQDEAAQLVTILLDPQPGETVLDACAGLGGKTAHMAQSMRNRGTITALDVNAAKLKLLAAEMNRLGISIVRPHTMDLSGGRWPDRFGPYDRILLDAPCSGLGVLRRNPDAKWLVQEAMLTGYGLRQAEFLDRLAMQVKPGGVLVYAVCSIEPDEGAAVVTAFLEKHRNYRLEDASDYMPLVNDNPLTRAGFLETFPHRHGTDGFFSARLRRRP